MREYQDIMNVAVVNFRQVWGNKESNLARIKGFIRAAAKQGADLIVFPEMALNGYDDESETERDQKMQIREAETIPGPSTAAIAEMTKEYGVYAVFGMAEREKEGSDIVYNAAAVCGPEGVIGSYRKIHPALAEQCWCERGNEPFSFDTPWGPIGIGICYDTYNFHELMRYYAASGCRLYLNPTAIGPSDRHDWRDYYLGGLKQGVNASEIFIASSNLTGNNMVSEDEGGSLSNIMVTGPGFGGGSMILGPGLAEKIHIYCGDVDDKEEGVFLAAIDLSLASRRNFKVDPIKNCPDYRPDIYKKLNEMLLETPYWKQFS
ncbi:MAG: carbon-nitrogen hydrolase family protein [Lachnospiraceae bacterium]|nr:carbon-nitrogen hydrolase family protein [Lachnospiraceae bacterium]